MALFVTTGVRDVGGVGGVSVPHLVPQVDDVAEGDQTISICVSNSDHSINLSLRNIISQGIS